jgi:uncharacterized protein
VTQAQGEEESIRLVHTPDGPARVSASRPPGIPVGLLVLGHGAGGLRWTDDVLATRGAAVEAGWVVALVDQPWRVAGRRIAGPPASLDRAWLDVLGAMEVDRTAGPLVVGGRSAGARVACRTAALVGASAVLALSFPLHPPGRPERSRADELRLPAADGIPVHVIQGTNDAFGTPDEVRAELARGSTLDEVPGTHSLERAAAPVAAAALARLPLA